VPTIADHHSLHEKHPHDLPEARADAFILARLLHGHGNQRVHDAELATTTMKKSRKNITVRSSPASKYWLFISIQVRAY